MTNKKQKTNRCYEDNTDDNNNNLDQDLLAQFLARTGHHCEHSNVVLCVIAGEPSSDFTAVKMLYLPLLNKHI